MLLQIRIITIVLWVSSYIEINTGFFNVKSLFMKYKYLPIHSRRPPPEKKNKKKRKLQIYCFE